MALASCGGGGSSSAGTTAAAPANAKAGSEVKSAAPSGSGDGGGSASGDGSNGGASASGAGAKPAGSTSGGGCQARIGDFLDRMTDLRQSLLAGLSYSEYVVRVRAIRDAYEAVPVDQLGVGCISGPAGEAEDAFNQYLRAANVWGECAGTEGCAASEIEGRLQHRWHLASKSLEAAERE